MEIPRQKVKILYEDEKHIGYIEDLTENLITITSGNANDDRIHFPLSEVIVVKL